MPETPIRVPKLGMDTTEALLVRWLAQEGASIQIGTPLVELETEKVTFEYQSEVTGRLARILIPEGQTVPVGEVVAIADTN
jgi:pyruvate/2-oxoglutarate dehydrogenase complex dihydrolipoamide acyltransferase (E2) component